MRTLAAATTMSWPSQCTRLLERFAIDVPLIQAPMAGVSGVQMAAAVCVAGGLGSLPCATLGGGDGVRQSAALLRSRLAEMEHEGAPPGTSSRPFALNFFCHESVPQEDVVAAQAEWRARLARYFDELGCDDEAAKHAPEGVGAPPGGTPSRSPFDDDACAAVEDVRPAVVSFHFGLPAQPLLQRVKDAGCAVACTATTVEEAVQLVDAGVDVVIAQGAEAGGHVGSFSARRGPADAVLRHAGTMALVPQVVDAVRVPVVAAGAVADGRGFAAALALGAAGVQLGTALLRCPESLASDIHREKLAHASDESTAVTNVVTGRPARGLLNRFMEEQGPLSPHAPPFPSAADVAAPLKAAAEARGSGDFSPLWAGQGAPLARDEPATDVVRRVVAEAVQVVGRLRAVADIPPK